MTPYKYDVFVGASAQTLAEAERVRAALAGRGLVVAPAPVWPQRGAIDRAIGLMESSAACVVIVGANGRVALASGLHNALVSRQRRASERFRVVAASFGEVGERCADVFGCEGPVTFREVARDAEAVHEVVLRLRGLSAGEPAAVRPHVAQPALPALARVLQRLRPVFHPIGRQTDPAPEISPAGEVPEAGPPKSGRLLALVLGVSPDRLDEAFAALLPTVTELWTEVGVVDDPNSVDRARTLLPTAHHLLTALVACGAKSRPGDAPAISFDLLRLTQLLQREALDQSRPPLLGEFVFSESQRRRLRRGDSEGAVHKQQRRVAFLARRVRCGTCQVRHDREVAELLGVSLFGLRTLRSQAPSVAALRQLQRQTGYAESP